MSTSCCTIGYDMNRTRMGGGMKRKGRHDCQERIYINGDVESFRGQSVGEKELVLSTMEEVSDLYTPAADTHLLHSLPAGAVYFGLFYRYIWLFYYH